MLSCVISIINPPLGLACWTFLCCVSDHMLNVTAYVHAFTVQQCPMATTQKNLHELYNSSQHSAVVTIQ